MPKINSATPRIIDMNKNLDKHKINNFKSKFYFNRLSNS